MKQINQLFFWELERVNSKPLPSAKWPVHPCVSDLGELPKLQEQWAAKVWSGEVSEIVPVPPTGEMEEALQSPTRPTRAIPSQQSRQSRRPPEESGARNWRIRQLEDFRRNYGSTPGCTPCTKSPRRAFCRVQKTAARMEAKE